MTAAVSTAAADSGEALVPASCRLSVLVGDDRMIDMLVPAAVPLGQLIEHLREALNKQLRAVGGQELAAGNYELARAAGLTRLAAGTSLAAQGIVDGDLVTLVPTGQAQSYAPTIEHVPSALAVFARKHFKAVSPDDAVSVAAALTGVALVAAAGLLWRLRWASAPPLVPAVLAGIAVTLAGIAAVAIRLGQRAPVTAGSAWAAAAMATVAGATAPPGPPGAPHAFLAGVIAAVAAVGVARVTQRYEAAAAAVVTVASTVAVVAAVRMLWAVPGPRIAVVVLVAVLIGGKVAPSIGRRLARVPRQSFASITGKDIFGKAPSEVDTLAPVASAPHDQTLSGEQVAAVAHRSNRVLLGVLVGIAVIQVAASIVAVNPGHPRLWPSIVIVVACAGVLILRARAFRDRRHAITTVCGAVIAVMSVPVHLAAAAPAAAGTTLVCAGVVVGIAVAGVVAAAVTPAHIFTETFRVVVEYTEYVVAALVVPFAAWAIGLFEYIRLR